MMERLPTQMYRAAEVELYPLQGRLTRAGQETHLRQKSLQVLVYLIEHRDRIVTKEELLANLWRDTVVTDGVLTQCIIDIRKALEDDSRQPKFIKNIPRVGYRFIHPVEELRLDGALNTLSLVEEETTSVEIEYTESLMPPPAAQSALLKRALGAGQFLSNKVRLISVLSMLMVAVVGLAVYRGRPPSRLASEAVLPLVPGKKPVVVLPFDDQTNSQELAWLRAGLPEMLITDLARAEHLNVISRQQLHLLLERINHAPGSDVRFDEAQELARRVRAEEFILGSFAKLDRQIRINVQLHETQTGRLLAAEQMAVDDQKQILPQLSLLTLKLATRLGKPRPSREANTQSAAVGTTNLEAFRYYSLGLEKAQGFENAEAISLLKKAVELDPQFAIAYARIGYAYALTWTMPEQARPYLEKAFALSHRLTEKDRLNIAAWYAIANLDYDGAIRAFHEIIKQYPLESEGYLKLARLLEGERRFDEAIDVIKQGLLVDPESKDLYNLLGSLMGTKSFDQAVAAHQKYVQLAPKEPNAYDSLGLTYQLHGRYEEAVTTYKQGLAIDPEFDIAVFHLANAYFQLGRYNDALDLYERYVQLAQSDAERNLGYRAMGLIHLGRGELTKATAVAAKETRALKKLGPVSFLLAVGRSDFQAAAKIVEGLRPLAEIGRGRRGFLRAHYWMLGYLALKRGQSVETLENFQEALGQKALVWDIDSLEDCLANAYLELGRSAEAISEYERILKFNPRYPLAHYHLGQAYERKGDTARARVAYEQFLQVWKDADADIHEVIEAKQRLRTI
jgi:tetratricopeptide (TPR) repeat protein/DNA-binding winged helix-turn-helix (wHTH) protein